MTSSRSKISTPPSDFRRGICASRDVLLDVESKHGGMTLAIRAIDILLDTFDRHEQIHREVSARPLPGVRS